jgi:acetylornithine aminotransferase
MIGFDLPDHLASLRKDLLFNHHIFTGEAKPNTVRLLPSLAMTKNEAELLLEAMTIEFKQTAEA